MSLTEQAQHTTDLFQAWFTLFCLALVIAGAGAWIYEAVERHRTRTRGLPPPSPACQRGNPWSVGQSMTGWRRHR